MRVVSLLPAATEWICALGAEGLLVGRSHACTYPASVQEVPVVTVDLERLRALRPDVIVTQDQCGVCAVSLSQLEYALADWTEGVPQIVSLQPVRLKHVFDTALRLGRVLGRMPEAMRLLADGEQRLRQLHDQLGLHIRIGAGEPSGPTVACLEWLDPLMTGGHWMPDVVAMAGGRAVLAEAGAASPTITWDTLRAADPDVLAVMPCGFTLEQTRRDLRALTSRPGWESLQAVRRGRVHLFDGDAYFNRPGPRLYRAIELLAGALHPERMASFGHAAEEWEREPLSTV